PREIARVSQRLNDTRPSIDPAAGISASAGQSGDFRLAEHGDVRAPRPPFRGAGRGRPGRLVRVGGLYPAGAMARHGEFTAIDEVEDLVGGARGNRRDPLAPGLTEDLSERRRIVFQAGNDLAAIEAGRPCAD